MEDLYSIHPGVAPVPPADVSDALKAQIAGHPRYPSLLSAYLDCRKIGAPPDVAAMLEEIGLDRRADADAAFGSAACFDVDADPELDEFMDSYCRMLQRYKEELSRPFDEASSFLHSIEAQLHTLCGEAPALTTTTRAKSAAAHSDEAAGSSSDDFHYSDDIATEGSSRAPTGGGGSVKEMLLKKYSGCLSRLRSEFLKKRKKGKLPKDARSALLDWWTAHYRWPYPTEDDKQRLAAATGLDPKQINNWFINQRKRHWKPSEDMRFALMEGLGGGDGGSSGGAATATTTTTTFYFDTGMADP